jgi:hypothetical protein
MAPSGSASGTVGGRKPFVDIALTVVGIFAPRSARFGLAGPWASTRRSSGVGCPETERMPASPGAQQRIWRSGGVLRYSRVQVAWPSFASFPLSWSYQGCSDSRRGPGKQLRPLHLRMGTCLGPASPGWAAAGRGPQSHWLGPTRRLPVLGGLSAQWGAIPPVGHCIAVVWRWCSGPDWSQFSAPTLCRYRRQWP